MIAPFVSQARRLAALDRQIDHLSSQVRQHNDQLREARQLDRLRVELDTKLDIIRELNRKRDGPAHIRRDLSHATPDHLWLIDFHEQSGTTTLTGMAIDTELIARFMRQLQDSAYFVAVDLVETSRSTATKAPGATAISGALTRFVVEAQLDYGGHAQKRSEIAPSSNVDTTAGVSP